MKELTIHLYRYEGVGPRGGRRLRWRAFDDEARVDVFSRTREGTLNLFRASKLYAEAETVGIIRYKGVARLSEVVAHLTELKMKANEAEALLARRARTQHTTDELEDPTREGDVR